MIIKLAVDKPFEKTLNKEDKAKYKALKAGAVAGGTLLGGKHIGHFYNDLKPNVGRVRRFIIGHNLANPRIEETVRKIRWTPGEAAKMAGIGMLAGGVLGLGTHLLHQKAKQLKQSEYSPP